MNRKTNRNIDSLCKICGKMIRSDHLKNHMKIKSHAVIEAMEADEKARELARWRAAYLKREEVRQEAEKIAMEIGASPECYAIASLPNPVLTLEEEIIRYSESYTAKLETGRQIYELLQRSSIMEESLTGKKRRSLKLYREQL